MSSRVGWTQKLIGNGLSGKRLLFSALFWLVATLVAAINAVGYAESVASVTPVGPAESMKPAESAESAEEYLLGPGDVLQIGVWGHEDLAAVVEVRPDGKISFPLVGDVAAEGLSPATLRSTLTQALAEYVRDPQVTVIVKEFRVLRVTVLGQVERPGQYQLKTGSRLLDAIAAAGGPKERAALQSVRIYPDGKVSDPARLKLGKEGLLFEGDVKENPVIGGGDTVFVPETRAWDWSKIVTYLTGLKLLRDLLMNQ